MSRNMKFVWILLAFCLVGTLGSAQQIFVYRGKIEFERKTNLHRLYLSDEDGDSWSENLKKLVPRFKVDYFDLVFDSSKSVYQPGRESDNPRKGIAFFESPAASNVVFKDLNRRISISQKQIFESRFLIDDSLNKISWKILPETRSIANFTCRKAVGRICDSVVVVAFYTDEIIPSNGPESFGGLPGMILELAIPRLYTTWIATRLELWEASDSRSIKAPVKGKHAKEDQVITSIDEGIKHWGQKYRARALWFSSL